MQNLNYSAMNGNLKMWEEITPAHIKTYQNIRLLKEGRQILDPIQLKDVGEVKGKSLLHLMCHLGTDSCGWVRAGATVTGVDFSPSALAFGRELAADLQLPVKFIESNLYEVEKHLDEQFDIVYTSMGVLCWLCDLKEWARIIARFLKTGGMFYIMEGHPASYIFDDMLPNQPLSVKYSYFHSPEPMVFDDDKPDYADPDFVAEAPSYEWTWSISDIINALIGAGLKIELFNEYDKLFYKHTDDMVTDDGEWWYHPKYKGMIPYTFSIRAKKE